MDEQREEVVQRCLQRYHSDYLIGIRQCVVPKNEVLTGWRSGSENIGSKQIDRTSQDRPPRTRARTGGEVVGGRAVKMKNWK